MVAQVGVFIVVTDADHAAKIFHQGTVGIISCRFIEKSSSVCIGIQQDVYKRQGVQGTVDLLKFLVDKKEGKV